MFLGMTAAVLIAVFGGWAYQNLPWAGVLLLAAAWLVATLITFLALFLVVWTMARWSPPSHEATDAAPFAGEELPPQWVVPEEPE
jgi:hypothetical protein